jgi:hypothetical protein
MIEYILNNWGDIVQIGLQVIGAASIIVKLTPTLKDDEILGKIKSLISKFIALNPNDSVKIKVKRK